MLSVRLWHVVFAFGWEQIALVMPGYLKHFTIAYTFMRWCRGECFEHLSLFQPSPRTYRDCRNSLFCSPFAS